MEQAIGKFNKSVMGKVVVFLDEAAATAAHAHMGSFKSLITDPTVRIEPKGMDGEEIANLSHIFVATNEEWSASVPEDSRRFFFLRVSDRYAYGLCPASERKAYFDALFAELEDDSARAAFLHLLLTRDLSTFDRFDKPVTDEEREQRLKSSCSPSMTPRS